MLIEYVAFPVIPLEVTVPQKLHRNDNHNTHIMFYRLVFLIFEKSFTLHLYFNVCSFRNM